MFNRMAPWTALRSNLAGGDSLDPLTTRTLASTLPCVDLSLRFGLGPGYFSDVSGTMDKSLWKNPGLGGGE